MRTIRNHVDLPLTVGRTLRLPEDTSAHLLKVLRLGAGASVWLFNGDGFDYEARLLDGNRRGAEAEVVDLAAKRWTWCCRKPPSWGWRRSRR